MARKEIVVVGGGIAGLPTAYQLKKELGEEVQVTLVCDRPQFHFIPSNPWLALGWRRPESAAFELAPLLQRRGIELRMEALQSVNPESREIVTGGDVRRRYDYLVLATGIRPVWAAVPGAGTDPRIHSVILPDEVARAHKGYREYLQKPGPIVIAAAPGASTIGPMYEYAFLLDADLRRRGLRGRASIVVITPEPWPGHLGLGFQGQQEPLRQALAGQDIEWIGDARLEEVGEGRIRFVGAGHSRNQSRPYAYAVIWPPFGGGAVFQHPGCCDDAGLIRVDDRLRVGELPNVFALGACTAKERITETAVPLGVPEAVYPTQQQAAVVARNIVHDLRGRPLESARIDRERWIVDMGEHGAAYLASPHLPLRDINWLRNGRWIFEAKRDFEDYFIHQVLFAAGAHAQVAALVRELVGQGRPPESAAGGHLPHSGVACRDDVRRRLESLAAELGTPAGELGEKLLGAAVAEARSCLDSGRRDRVDARIRERLLAELDVERERVRFEGGAP